MSSREPTGRATGSAFADQAVNVRRYVDAIRRGAWLIAVIAVTVTVLVLVISLAAAKIYKASASVGYDQARSQLQAQIAALRGNPAAASQVAALQERINALQINAADTTSVLQISEPATPPAGAASPRPGLNALIALFASLIVGVLV